MKGAVFTGAGARIFNDKVYHFAGDAVWKADADKMAKAFRRNGFLVRIVRRKHDYLIYRRQA